MPGIDTGEIHLWSAFPGAIANSGLLATYESILSDEEREKWQRFHFERDQHRYLITRALARTVLSRYVAVKPRDWIFATNDFGRPRVLNIPGENAGLSFNISHTDGLILMGVTAGAAIGVDVENFTSSDRPLSIAKRYFAADETAALLALPEEEQRRRFFDLWTLKESYIKARGMGLSIPLDGFSFGFPTEHTVGFSSRVPLGDDPARWQFWQFEPASGFTAAVCAGRTAGPRPALKFITTVPLVSATPGDILPLRQSPF